MYQLYFDTVNFGNFFTFLLHSDIVDEAVPVTFARYTYNHCTRTDIKRYTGGRNIAALKHFCLHSLAEMGLNLEMSGIVFFLDGSG